MGDTGNTAQCLLLGPVWAPEHSWLGFFLPRLLFVSQDGCHCHIGMLSYTTTLTLAIACLESPHVSSCLKVQTLLCDPLALREVTLQVYLPSSRTLLVLSI